MLMQIFLSIIHPAYHLGVNGIKPGSNSKLTDKHTAEHSNTTCSGVDWSVCDVFFSTYNNIARSINVLDRNAIF